MEASHGNKKRQENVRNSGNVRLEKDRRRTTWVKKKWSHQ